MQVTLKRIAGALAALALAFTAASHSASADSSGGGHGVSLNPTGLPPAGPPGHGPAGPPVGAVPGGPPPFRDGADLLSSLWPIPDKGIGSLIPDVPYLNHVYGATDFRPCERRDADGYLYQAC